MALSWEPSVSQRFALPAAEDLIVKQDEKRGKYVAGCVTNWTLVTLNHHTQVRSHEHSLLPLQHQSSAARSLS